MVFTNSPLVSYTRISPYRSSREGHAIDTITIHCAAAQAEIETLGKLFQTKPASANYGIGLDGRVCRMQLAHSLQAPIRPTPQQLPTLRCMQRQPPLSARVSTSNPAERSPKRKPHIEKSPAHGSK